MFERFTEGARLTVVLAQEEARERGDDHIGAAHLLVGVSRSEGVAGQLLARRGATPEAVRRAALGEPGRGTSPAQLPFTRDAKKALELSLREALSLGSRDIRVRHVLLALTHADGLRPAFAALRIAREDLREELRAAPGPAPDPDDPGAPVVVRLGDRPIGDLGHPRVDARLLLSLLARGGDVATWLAERGVDEASVRADFGDLLDLES